MIERSAVGVQAAATQEIENYPSFSKGVRGDDLADKWQEQATRFGVEILQAQAVVGIDGDSMYKIVKTESGQEDFIGADVHFCATCDGPFYKGKDVMVEEGGNTGFQEGLFLTRFASKVSILEFMAKPIASAILQDKVVGMPQMDVRARTTILEFRGDTKLRSVLVKDLENGNVTEEHPGAVFVFIGLTPHSQFLKGTLDLDSMGFIVTGNNRRPAYPASSPPATCSAASR